MSALLPKDFTERIEKQFGTQAGEFLAAFDSTAPTSIRLNKSKKTNAITGIPVEELEKVAWHSDAYYLAERPIFTADPAFHAGTYYVQEASSMFVAEIVKHLLPSFDEPLKVLDLCAAPGGKSTLILDTLPEKSLLVANEVIKARAGILVDNITKWGNPNCIVTSNDPRDFKRLEDFFDIMVIDAPCSGEGMFRKDKRAIEEWSEENVKTCTLRQRRIMDDILPSLKPDGYIIYSTCTFSPEENEENIAHFAKTYGLKSIRIPFDQKSGIVEEIFDVNYLYKFFPNRIKGEGFCVSCLQKKGTVNTDYVGRNTRIEFLSKKLIPVFQKWLNRPERFEFIVEKEHLYALPKTMMEDYAVVSRFLYPLSKGILMGKMMGTDLIPSLELALSIDISKDVTTCELNKEQALTYLKKGDVSGFEPISALPNGWAVIRYMGNNLGWIKKIGHRTNNYYPKEMRILKDF